MNTPFFEDNERKLRPLLDYYEKTWLGKPKRGGRREPLFPHSLWNCYNTTAVRNSRTNNSVEGWNRRFNTLVGAQHPSIWTVIDKFKDEQNVSEMKLNQLIAVSSAPTKRKAYRDLEVRLLRIVEDYANMPLSDYLLGISQNIAFYV
jgi:hypothetical protein